MPSLARIQAVPKPPDQQEKTLQAAHAEADFASFLATELSNLKAQPAPLERAEVRRPARPTLSVQSLKDGTDYPMPDVDEEYRPVAGQVKDEATSQTAQNAASATAAATPQSVNPQPAAGDQKSSEPPSPPAAADPSRSVLSAAARPEQPVKTDPRLMMQSAPTAADIQPQAALEQMMIDLQANTETAQTIVPAKTAPTANLPQPAAPAQETTGQGTIPDTFEMVTSAATLDTVPQEAATPLQSTRSRPTVSPTTVNVATEVDPQEVSASTVTPPAPALVDESTTTSPATSAARTSPAGQTNRAVVGNGLSSDVRLQSISVEGSASIRPQSAQPVPLADQNLASLPGIQAAAVQNNPASPVLIEPARLAEAHSTGLTRQVSLGIENLVRSGSNTLNLQLNPKDLGQISLRLTSTAEGTLIFISAEQPLTADLLDRHMHDLRQSLSNAGVQLSGLFVQSNGPDGQANQSSYRWLSHQAEITPALSAEFEQTGVQESAITDRGSDSSRVDYRV